MNACAVNETTSRGEWTMDPADFTYTTAISCEKEHYKEYHFSCRNIRNKAKPSKPAFVLYFKVTKDSMEYFIERCRQNGGDIENIGGPEITDEGDPSELACYEMTCDKTKKLLIDKDGT